MISSFLPEIILFLVCCWIARPIQVCIHEIGHALLAYLLTSGKIALSLGQNTTPALQTRRLTLHLSPHRWDRGSVRFDREGVSSMRLAMIMVAGASTNLISVVVAAFFVMLDSVYAVPMTPFIFYGLKVGLLAAYPFKYRSIPIESDGHAFLRLVHYSLYHR